MSEFAQTLIAVFIGFLLGLGGEWLKDYRNNRRIKKTIKTSITFEIEHNKILLREFWEIVSLYENHWFDENREFNFIVLAKALNHVPFPYLNTKVWGKYFDIIPNYFSKNESKTIWKLYENIELLYQIKEHLIFNENAVEKMEHKMGEHIRIGRNILGEVISSFHLNNDSDSLAKKFKEVIENIIGIEAVKFKNRKPD